MKTFEKNREATPVVSMVFLVGQRITPLVSPWSTTTRRVSKPSERGRCCTRSARRAHHGTLFPFLVLTFAPRLRADDRCCAVQARLCRKSCGYVIGLGPYLLSMTSLPFALVAIPGFSSFHFRFAPSDKRTFCHLLLVTLLPSSSFAIGR